MSNRAAVITVSDRCAANPDADESGPAIVQQLADLDATLVGHAIVPDDVEAIRAAIRDWIDRAELVLLTGGTGIAPRDVTPEAVEPLLERTLPGFGEAMRMTALPRTPLAIVSRSGAGIAGRTLVVWMPGSPKAARECLEVIAPAVRHVCAFLRGEPPH